jgi:hypothetical protein
MWCVEVHVLGNECMWLWFCLQNCCGVEVEEELKHIHVLIWFRFETFLRGGILKEASIFEFAG